MYNCPMSSCSKENNMIKAWVYNDCEVNLAIIRDGIVLLVYYFSYFEKLRNLVQLLYRETFF